MPLLERLRSLFDARHIPYSLTTHRPATRASELAWLEHLPAWEVAKCVVVFEKNRFHMIVVPADRHVDLYEVASVLGVDHVRLATEEELSDLFPDCELGAMPPLGVLYDLPVTLDADLASETMISFAAGTHTETIHMRFDDYRKLTRPHVASLTRVEATSSAL
jgi:Ala-tRNA(Pro) deacylase